MARYRVTSRSGYFGPLFVQRLGPTECRIFDLNDADDRDASTRFKAGDVRDAEAITAAARGLDVIFYNVAQVPQAKDRQLFSTVTIDGTRNMLGPAERQGVGRVVYFQLVGGVHCPADEPRHRRHPARPRRGLWPNEVRARTALLAIYTRRTRHLDHPARTIMGHYRLGILQVLFEWICRGRNVPVLGTCNNVYQFVNAEDLADACILAAKRTGPRTYNCGTDRFGTIWGVLEALCRFAGTASKARFVPMTQAV